MTLSERSQLINMVLRLERELRKYVEDIPHCTAALQLVTPMMAKHPTPMAQRHHVECPVCHHHNTTSHVVTVEDTEAFAAETQSVLSGLTT